MGDVGSIFIRIIWGCIMTKLTNPKVSVVVCTHSIDRYNDFTECVQSIQNQSYANIEIVVISDGNTEVYEAMQSDFNECDNIKMALNDSNRGISYSRNRGANIASGDIVAFTDDDSIAEPDWIESLVEIYDETDAIAVGGDVQPSWLTDKPSWFPEEFYWLVGVVEPGFAEDEEELRNTYGSNISYLRDAFLEVGGYDPNTGRQGSKQIQVHEAPAGIRLQEKYGKGVVFTDTAVTNHKLYDYRSEFWWLLRRSFWQGYSQRILELLYPDGEDTKDDYLKDLLTDRYSLRLKRVVKGSIKDMLKLTTMTMFTATVGIGYLIGRVKERGGSYE